VAMSRDGRRLVAAERGGDVKVWDLDSGCELPVLHGAESNELAISGDARLIAAASYSHGQMTIWDLEKGRKLYAFPGKRKNSYSCLSMSEDGRRLVSSDWDELHVWDIENGSQIHTLRGHEHCIQGVSVSRDGLLAVSACEDNTLKVWDIESGRCAATFTDDGGLLTCALTPDQRMIVAGGTRCVMHFLRFEKVNVRRLRVRSDRV